MNLKMWLNWKVLTGLGVIGIAIWLFEPKLIVAAVPVLLVAACPLSMLLMMGGMGKMAGMKRPVGAGTYTCPMHSTVHSDQPGRCPTCGMNLMATGQARQLPPEVRTDLSREDHVAELKTQLSAMEAEQ